MESIQTELNLDGLTFPEQEIGLTEPEKKVLNLIPLGKENAVSGSYICNLLDISSRHLTDQARRLRLKHYDVGSTTYDGYYRFLNPTEYLKFMNMLSSELTRSEQVIEAMRLTPMAQKITIDTNQMAIVQSGLDFHGLIFPNRETKLSELEKRLLNLIPLGKENMLTCAYIANALDICTRHVKKLIRELRLKHYDIGSTTDGGYYQFQTPMEYSEFMNKLSKELARSKQVMEAMRLTPMARQIVIETNQTA